MSKERLEEIKEKYSKANVIEHLNGIDIIAVAKEDIVWLIQQSELMQHFTRKNTELNVFLNKYSEPKHFGENVIDVAMDIIGKQAERVQELESRIADDEHFVVEILEQNKHYRELLESIKNSFHKYLTAQTNESDLIADVDFFTKEIYLALEESK